MQVRVLMFASVREALGASELVIQELTSPMDLTQLKVILQARYPKLARMQFAMAKNKNYCSADALLEDGDEIALIPPVSGG